MFDEWRHGDMVLGLGTHSVCGFLQRHQSTVLTGLVSFLSEQPATKNTTLGTCDGCRQWQLSQCLMGQWGCGAGSRGGFFIGQEQHWAFLVFIKCHEHFPIAAEGLVTWKVVRLCPTWGGTSHNYCGRGTFLQVPGSWLAVAPEWSRELADDT